jgi:hypothetical protein
MLELRSVCLVQHTLVKMALEDLNHLSTTNNCAQLSHSQQLLLITICMPKSRQRDATSGFLVQPLGTSQLGSAGREWGQNWSHAFDPG